MEEDLEETSLRHRSTAPRHHHHHQHRRRAKKVSSQPTTNYDDVFGGPPKHAVPFSGVPDDYSEVFGGVSVSCSIPFLDLPTAQMDGWDCASGEGVNGVDYGEIFGRFDFADFAVPYEELFGRGRTDEGEMDMHFASANGRSSFKSRSGPQTIDPSAFIQEYSNEDNIPYLDDANFSVASDEMPVEYNTSYSKSSRTRSKEVLHTTASVPQPQTGFTFVVEPNKPLPEHPAPVNEDTATHENNVKPNTKSAENTQTITNKEAEQPGVPFLDVADVSLLTRSANLPPPARPPPSKLLVNERHKSTIPKTDPASNLSTEGKQPPLPQQEKPKSFLKSDSLPPNFDFVPNLKLDKREKPKLISRPTFSKSESLPPGFGSELDAMKEAMEFAQARLKTAKELHEKRREGKITELPLRKKHVKEENLEGSEVEKPRILRSISLASNFSKSREFMKVQSGVAATQGTHELEKSGKWRSDEEFHELTSIELTKERESEVGITANEPMVERNKDSVQINGLSPTGGGLTRNLNADVNATIILDRTGEMKYGEEETTVGSPEILAGSQEPVIDKEPIIIQNNFNFELEKELGDKDIETLKESAKGIPNVEDILNIEVEAETKDSNVCTLKVGSEAEDGDTNRLDEELQSENMKEELHNVTQVENEMNEEKEKERLHKMEEEILIQLEDEEEREYKLEDEKERKLQMEKDREEKEREQERTIAEEKEGLEKERMQKLEEESERERLEKEEKQRMLAEERERERKLEEERQEEKMREKEMLRKLEEEKERERKLVEEVEKERERVRKLEEEKERERERVRKLEEEKQREREMALKLERDKERERKLQEEIEKERERVRKLEEEREQEREKVRKLEQERELERERVRKLEEEREQERERVRQLEEERERERIERERERNERQKIEKEMEQRERERIAKELEQKEIEKKLEEEREKQRIEKEKEERDKQRRMEKEREEKEMAMRLEAENRRLERKRAEEREKMTKLQGEKAKERKTETRKSDEEREREIRMKEKERKTEGRKSDEEREKAWGRKSDEEKERERGRRARKEREIDERERDKEEEEERQREREKDRLAMERATQERAERIAIERITAARQRAVENREKEEMNTRGGGEGFEKKRPKGEEEKKERDGERNAREARLRAERAAVERATAEARERAIEKAKAEADKDRLERLKSFNRISSQDNGHESHFKRTHSDSALSQGHGESALRHKARLERQQRTAERAAKALAEKNRRDIMAQREQAERDRIAEHLDADVRRWSSGKEGNLRALLSTLQYILGQNSGWQPIHLTEVITAADVKRAYRKATLYVHPDKLQQRGASIQQKYICEKVFDLLKEAWNKFNSEER